MDKDYCANVQYLHGRSIGFLNLSWVALNETAKEITFQMTP